MTIQTLVQALDAIGYDKLPPRLVLQMDNCGGENKNKFVIAFIGFLVKRKIFEQVLFYLPCDCVFLYQLMQVEINFLPVGHTHEDVDQFFSRLSVYLKKVPAQTVKDIEKAWPLCFTPTPKVFTSMKWLISRPLLQGFVP